MNKQRADEMVGKWSVKNPLTIEERIKIKEGLDLNLSYSQLAVFVGRYKSTVMREAKRLGTPEEYDPFEAQRNFEQGQIDKYRRITATLKAKRARKVEVVDSTVKHSESRP